MLSIDTMPHYLHAPRRAVSIDEPSDSSLEVRPTASVDSDLGQSRAVRGAHEQIVSNAMRSRQDHVLAQVSNALISSEEDEDNGFIMGEGSHYTPADSEKTSAAASWASRAFDSLVDRS